MARESDGGLRYIALIAQEGKETLHEAEASRHSTWGELVAEGGFNPDINIARRGLCQVRIESGLPRLGHEDREAFERADGAFLHGGCIVARTQVGQIVGDHALVLGTEKMQSAELRELLQRWGGRSLLHTSLLLHEPRFPVDDTELR